MVAYRLRAMIVDAWKVPDKRHPNAVACSPDFQAEEDDFVCTVIEPCNDNSPEENDRP